MISSIITILVGLFVSFMLPDWIKFGDKKTRDFVRLVFNVVGVIIILSGIISLIKFFLSM